MSIARTTELSATSEKGFEDAVKQGLARAAMTIRQIRSAWIKEQMVVVKDGSITQYKVHMLITFELED